MTDALRTIATEEVACDFCGSREGEVVARGRDFEYDTCANEWTFVRCRSCALVYLNPRPAISELDTIYPPSYEPFHFHETGTSVIMRARDYVQGRTAHAIRKLIPEDAAILDVGCGSGQFLHLLRRHGSPKWRLYGNDFSDAALDAVKSRGFDVLRGRFETIETDLRFDMIVLNQAIEHLESPSDVVRKGAELLAPNGVFFIETPSTSGLDARLFRDRYWGGYHFPRHWTLFDERTLTRLVEKFGLAVVDVKSLPSPAFWTQCIHHYCLDRGWTTRARFWTIWNPFPLALFTTIDLIAGTVGPTSNMRLVARKAAQKS